MGMYAKLFTSMYQGTLRGNSHGLLVFTNLLAHADAGGTVDMHPRAIAEEVGLPVDDVKAALRYLEAPDEESRSPELDGRRIVRMDEHREWGWTIVNYAKYRAIRNEDDRKAQNRESQERWRNRNKQDKQSKPPSAHAEAEVKADTKAERYKNIAPDGVAFQVWQDFRKLRERLRAPITATAMAGIQREADKAGISLETALVTCCERGWRGFKADWMHEAPAAKETAYQRSMRERVAEFSPALAKRQPKEIIDVTAIAGN